MTTRPAIDAIAEAIEAAMPELDATDRRIVVAIQRLMSSGEPVEPAVIARASGAPVLRVEERLDSWPGVYRDDQGRAWLVFGAMPSRGSTPSTAS